MTVERMRWLKRNPLRLWLANNDETIADFSARVGRNPTTVHMWLKGAINPTSSFGRIAAITGDTEIEVKWENWADDQPGKFDE